MAIKAFWQISGTEWVSYDPNIHLKEAWIFLYWDEEEILVVGWPRSFKLDYLCHAALSSMAQRKEIAPDKIPNGAGLILANGRIQSWCSDGFRLTTPESLRPKILAALGITP